MITSIPIPPLHQYTYGLKTWGPMIAKPAAGSLIGAMIASYVPLNPAVSGVLCASLAAMGAVYGQADAIDRYAAGSPQIQAKGTDYPLELYVFSAVVSAVLVGLGVTVVSTISNNRPAYKILAAVVFGALSGAIAQYIIIYEINKAVKLLNSLNLSK